MYLAHWGLTRSPFAGAGGPFFAGETQAEALARLRFAAASGLSSIVVGAAGVGKTRLVERFAGEARSDGRAAARIIASGLAPRDLLAELASRLSLGPRSADDVARLHRRLADFAVATASLGAPPIAIVDDADALGPDARAQLVRLIAAGAPWSLVLVSSPAGAARIGGDLIERLDLKIDVEPWSETETIGYVQHALVDAGCERPAFDDDALGVLFTLSDGVPRRVNRLADHALLGAAAEGLAQVDAGMVEAAHDAIAWTAAVY